MAAMAAKWQPMRSEDAETGNHCCTHLFRKEAEVRPLILQLPEKDGM